jgi:hypothetical protein
VCGPLDRVTTAVAACCPERLEPAVDALYDLGLELVSAGVVGPGSRCPSAEAAWSVVLTACAPLVAAEPRRVAAAVTNAIYNVERDKPGAGAHWIAAAPAVAAASQTVGALLDGLLVLAWRSGLAHYRSSAIERLRSLPDAVARRALGVASDGPPVADLCRRLDDPWWNPSWGTDSGRTLQVVARVGGFRGLDGPFTRPPQVAASDGHLVAFDRDSCWTIYADVFGTMLTRLASDAPAARDQPRADFTIDQDGTVTCRGMASRFEELRDVAGFAATPWTLAVALRQSHHVHLVALAERVAP